VSEPMGRGGVRPIERGTSDEGRRRIDAPPAVSGKHGTSEEGRRRLEAPRSRAGDMA
jgi:hypothetical protein